MIRASLSAGVSFFCTVVQTLGLEEDRTAQAHLCRCYQGRRRSSCLQGVPPKDVPMERGVDRAPLSNGSVEEQSCLCVPSFCDLEPGWDGNRASRHLVYTFQTAVTRSPTPNMQETRRPQPPAGFPLLARWRMSRRVASILRRNVVSYVAMRVAEIMRQFTDGEICDVVGASTARSAIQASQLPHPERNGVIGAGRITADP